MIFHDRKNTSHNSCIAENNTHVLIGSCYFIEGRSKMIDIIKSVYHVFIYFRSSNSSDIDSSSGGGSSSSVFARP